MSHAIELVGLDAGNLLAYMAALGALRTLSRAAPDADIRLSWNDAHGWWTPVLHYPTASAAELTVKLAAALSGDPNSAWEMGEDLTIPVAAFAARARAAVETGARVEVEFLAAFGSDGCLANPKLDLIADTAFRTMSGAGHQHFLGFMKELQRSTTSEHLHAALFETWEYGDDKPSMRWDPNDYRPHALRANDPATDPIRTVRGANRLAVEALPLFPTAPCLRGLRTTGFDLDDGLTYPVWTPPLDYAEVASVLALNFDQRMHRSLRTRGIQQLYRTTRFTEGKYRNFSPSKELM